MVQSWNGAAVRTLWRVLRTPALAKPHRIVNDIRDINFDDLKTTGVRAVAFDRDNTLSRPYERSVFPPLQQAFDACVTAFGPARIVVVSNSAGTAEDDADGADARATEAVLGVPVLRHAEKKPRGVETLLAHFAARNVTPAEIAVIGDRLLTDIVYGNLGGCRTILVARPLDETRDNRVACAMRRLEHAILRFIPARTGTLPRP